MADQTVDGAEKSTPKLRRKGPICPTCGQHRKVSGIKSGAEDIAALRARVERDLKRLEVAEGIVEVEIKPRTPKKAKAEGAA